MLPANPTAARRRWSALAGLGCLLLSAACGTMQPKVPLDRVAAGDWVAVEEFALRELERGKQANEALLQNVRGQAEMFQGRLDDARRSFATAYQIMGTWAVAGGEVYKAIFGDESSKTFRGDPYERGMNALYLALLDLWHGEPDNARACLINGILADAESAPQDDSGQPNRVREDNALLFWMAGRMGRLAGSSDVAEYFAEAQQAKAFAVDNGSRGSADNPILQRPDHGNVVLLIECGLGPAKYNTGDGDPIVRFREQGTALGRWRSEVGAAASARVEVNGQNGGPAHTLGDVFYQATTRGGTAMEGIRKGKAVFKAAATVAGVHVLGSALRDRDARSAAAKTAVAGALLVAAMVVSSDADTRHWPTLPSVVQVATLDLPPGVHRIAIEFFDDVGARLASLRQEFELEVPARGEAWVLVRAASGPAVAGPAVRRKTAES